MPLHSLAQVEWRISGCLRRNPTAWSIQNPLGERKRGMGGAIVIMSGSSAVEHGFFYRKNIQLTIYTPSNSNPILQTRRSSRQFHQAQSRPPLMGAAHVIDHSLPLPAISAQVSEITADPPITFDSNAILEPDTQKTAYDLLPPSGGIPRSFFWNRPRKRLLGKQWLWLTPKSIRGAAIGLSLYEGTIKFFFFFLPFATVEVVPGGLADIPKGLANRKCQFLYFGTSFCLERVYYWKVG